MSELLPCPFCGAAMVELERGNYAEHPWSEADGFCHMRGFSVHRSRYDWWNRRSPSRQSILEEAVKVADIYSRFGWATAGDVARAIRFLSPDGKAPAKEGDAG